MTKKELIEGLRAIADRVRWDPEGDHGDADDLLLAYINDPGVTATYDRIERWYA